MDMDAMMAETTRGDAAPQATGADADAEEMPLLFMDGLPSGFQQSAQLAALATFMADSDGDGDQDDDEGDDGEDERGAGKRPASARRKLARRKTRTPYARPQVKDSAVDADKANNKDKKKEKEKEGDATKELQLYLSMFKV